MQTSLNDIIKEAILMEKNVARLYILFHENIVEDANFWWELALEEENHAALLKTAREMISMKNIEMPEGLLPESLEALKASNDLIVKYKESFEKNPSRTRALHVALEIENSAGELHYDQFMHQTPDSKIRDVFLRLNGDDIDHAQRIKDYMIRQAIPLPEAE